MEKREELVEHIYTLREDEKNKEAIDVVVGVSNVLGYLEALGDMGKAITAGGCFLVIAAWAGKKFL